MRTTFDTRDLDFKHVLCTIYTEWSMVVHVLYTYLYRSDMRNVDMLVLWDFRWSLGTSIKLASKIVQKLTFNIVLNFISTLFVSTIWCVYDPITIHSVVIVSISNSVKHLHISNPFIVHFIWTIFFYSSTTYKCVFFYIFRVTSKINNNTS